MAEKQNSQGKAAPSSTNKINQFDEETTNLPAPPTQLPLDIGIRVEKSINGIEMGVLENGMPYLTQTGLAQMVGVVRQTIAGLTKEWEDRHSDPVIGKDRNGFLRSHLFSHGYDDPNLYISIIKDGSIHYAYPEIVCMAVLEYYAFESQNPNETATKNFRNLARYGLQKFIYDALQYVPADNWRYFHDRVSILQNTVQPGYFIVFRETTDLIVDLINSDLEVNDATLPDISVGQIWAKYWSDNDLEVEFGQRIRHEHNFPSYFRQARSNPQDIWAYPDAALARFRQWFRGNYLCTKFPNYILKKAGQLPGGRLEAKQIAEKFAQKSISN